MYTHVFAFQAASTVKIFPEHATTTKAAATNTSSIHSKWIWFVGVSYFAVLRWMTKTMTVWWENELNKWTLDGYVQWNKDSIRKERVLYLYYASNGNKYFLPKKFRFFRIFERFPCKKCEKENWLSSSSISLDVFCFCTHILYSHAVLWLAMDFLFHILKINFVWRLSRSIQICETFQRVID